MSIWCIHYGIVLLLILNDFVYGQGPPCTGQTLGEASPSLTGVTTGTNTGFSFILLDNSMAVPCCGVVSEFRYATKAAGDLTAQIWRRSAANVYEVLGEKTTSVTSDSNSVLTIAASEQTSVQQNDRIGWYSSGTDIIPYLATGSAIMGRVSQSGKTNVGTTTSWSTALNNGEQWMFGAVLSAGATPSFGSSLPFSTTAQTTDPVGTVVHTLTPTDDNPDDIAGLTVTIDPASTEFEYDAATSEVKILTAPLAANTYELVLKVVDQCDLTGTATLTIVVADNPPNITSLPIAAALLEEETTTETLLHTLVYTDDGALTDVSCTMTTPTDAPFVLKYIPPSSNYGIYFTGSTLDYETTPLYQMFVTCNDGTSDSDTKEFQVSIEPNESPVLTVQSNIVIDAEFTEAGVTFYTASATDPENDALTYSMNCSCPFAMNSNGELYATEDLNTHKTTPYTIEVTVTDTYNNDTGTAQITITNINHAPNLTYPTQIAPLEDEVRIDEHTSEGTPNPLGTTIDVATITGFDDDGDTITYEFDFENGQGQDFFDFDTTTGLITTNQDLDYETLSAEGLLNTRVYVRAYDGREYSDQRVLNIIVDDVNETPQFAKTKYAIETGETTATTTLSCPEFAVIEEDNYDTRTYSMDCGTVVHFQIVNSNSANCDAYIVQTEEDDQDDPGAEFEVITCTVTVTDKGGLTNTTTLEITVHEEDDNPPVLTQTSYTYTITNDTTPGSTFGNADATDADFLAEHRRHTYSTDSSEFGVSNNGIFFSKVDWTGTNAPVTRSFTLTVTDEAGNTDTAPVTVNIVDVPTTTTTTTTTTPVPSTFDSIGSFFDDPGNLAWFIPALLLGLLALGLLGFMLMRCCMSPGACASVGRICSGSSGGCFKSGPRRLFRGGGGRGGGHMVKTRHAAPPQGHMVGKRLVGVKKTVLTRHIVPGPTQTVVGGPMLGSGPQPITQPLTQPPTPSIFEKPPVEEEPPPKKKSSGFFDLFKSKKPKSPPSQPQPVKPNVPEPANANEGKPFAPWSWKDV